MTEIADNLVRIHGQIQTTAAASGRTAADITLVAVTKTQPLSAIRAAVKAGITICGENRVQELTEKHAANAFTGAQVHLIGHLQKNKVKKIAGTAALIHSVDSLALLSAIHNAAEGINCIQDVLIQVNIGKDPGKFGIEVEELDEMLIQAGNLAHVKVRGLMTILPFSLPATKNRQLFSQMYQLFVDIRVKTYHNIAMDFLSMGMSADFEDAILEGANMVRIGSALFEGQSLSAKNI